MESLESRIEDIRERNRADWKQWLPLYGPVQIAVDGLGERPTIFDYASTFKRRAVGVYHVAMPTLLFLGSATTF